jgi:dTDP-4-amino-4,6-dideoxygalactose transaminase
MEFMRVPFVDLKAQYASVKDEIDEAVMRVMSETAFVAGRYASIFEEEFAQYLGASHCIAVANGTDAIEIALQAIGVGAGDEVILPANTFIATAEGVSNIGAVPVFVDIDTPTYNIDPAKIEEKITARTKAIIPVHLYGLPADMDAVMDIARSRSLKVLEDCAQAHGATYNGVRVGTYGDAATFSFYPSKNLGAFGDAGAIVTNDAETADAARLVSNHGQASKNRHTIVGRNSRMDGIQAAVLSVKLRHLDKWLEARRANAANYNQLLDKSDIVTPKEPAGSRHVYHLYVIQADDREALMAKLDSAGVDCGIHYPTPLPLTEAYARLRHSAADFPIAASIMDRIISLPMYAELTGGMIEHVATTLEKALPRTLAAKE